MSSVLTVLAATLLAWTAAGTVYLGVLSLAGSLPPPRRRAAPPLAGRISIVVPAHNEGSGLGRTLLALTQLARSDGDCRVVVVADNCDDDTAAVARAARVHLLQRHDPRRRGKGYALDYAFRQLAPDGDAAYLVIDADSVPDANLLASVRRELGAGAGAVQARYTVLNGEANGRTRLAALGLAAFNVLRPRARARLGLSAGILGNGFALRPATLAQVPYRAASVVEDLEYHLLLLEAGLRVAFADDSSVRGDMPSGSQGMRQQRARWEGGRLRQLRARGPGLLRAVLHGHWRLLEPLLELALPPLGYHCLLLLLGAACAWGAGQPWLLAALLASLLLLAGHVLAAVRAAGLPYGALWSLLRLPAYLLWKLRQLGPILAGARRDSAWVRTNRHGE